MASTSGVSVSALVVAIRRARRFMCASQVEHGVESAMDAHERRDAANGNERAVDIGTCAASRIVANGQRLIGHTEDDLGADHEARKTNRMHLRPRERRTP